MSRVQEASDAAHRMERRQRQGRLVHQQLAVNLRTASVDSMPAVHHRKESIKTKLAIQTMLRMY
jgi:hypothetical protein